jgi:hypothetical protein
MCLKTFQFAYSQFSLYGEEKHRRNNRALTMAAERIATMAYNKYAVAGCSFLARDWLLMKYVGVGDQRKALPWTVTGPASKKQSSV